MGVGVRAMKWMGMVVAAACSLWLLRRKAHRSGRPTVIVKLGGSAITVKSQRHQLESTALHATAAQIHNAIEQGIDVILIHGAGSFGHFEAKEFSISKGDAHEQWRLGF